ncbi:MAG: hypothetical protein R2856_17735 [Caldilineaceae bacterium]
MKIVLRTLIILAAALAVTGALWAFGNSSLMAQLNLGPGGRDRSELREGMAFPSRTSESADTEDNVFRFDRTRPDFGAEGTRPEGSAGAKASNATVLSASICFRWPPSGRH